MRSTDAALRAVSHFLSHRPDEEENLMHDQPFHLRVAALTEPLGLDVPRPDLSWLLPSPGEGQAAYEVEVATDSRFPADALVWSTGKLAGTEPFGITYAGAPLLSCSRYWWRVRVWRGEASDPGAWSNTASFEMGILDPTLWQANWIAGPAERKDERRALYARGDIAVPEGVIRARAYVTALGWYRFLVNGGDLTGPALVPRWTPCASVIEYQTYDVTAALREGNNVLGVIIGDGRFRGSLGLFAKPGAYGDRLAALVQVHLDMADGSRRVLASDESWRIGRGQILASDPMRGERADLRISSTEWLSANAPPSSFGPPVLLAANRALIGEAVGRVREIERLPVQEIYRSPSGQQIIDFGQNFAGVVRIRLRGKAGTVVRLGHSEVIGIDGEVDLKYHSELPGVRWSQTDEVTLDGGDVWWSPWFTIHGFRYVSVDGLDHDLELADAEGIVISSALEPGGSFDCSDGRLNQLYRNVFWSLRSNFTDTPTDCPTRERAGWTGDIQLFAPTAAKLADVQAYLRRYLANLGIEQMPGGEVPIFIPSQVDNPSGMSLIMMRYMAEAAGWGDAAVLLPWTLYQHYGDRTVLETQYVSMTNWVECMARRAARKPGFWRKPKHRRPPEIERYIVDSGFDFGEWLRPGTEGLDKLFDGLKLGGVVATAYLAHSAGILAQIAAILGRREDEGRYRDLAVKTRQAWRNVYLQSDGTIGTNRQDDYVRALVFDLLEPGERSAATARLVALIEAADNHLGTGFLSTPMLLPALADNGRMDVAWRLLLQTTNPSWLHQIARGATTVWETWEGYKADGSPDQSHNHYTFGAVANFLIERIVGLAPAAPGYRTIAVRPGVDGPLARASGSLQTPYGPVAAAWQKEGDAVVLHLVVPPGVNAEVHLGSGDVQTVGSGEHKLMA